tara:strand:- start:336 stop:503 length:168 start_codon:yes stop_codon:yes gene_type:complete
MNRLLIITFFIGLAMIIEDVGIAVIVRYTELHLALLIPFFILISFGIAWMIEKIR